MTLVLIVFYKISVFSQMRFLIFLFEKSNVEKRAWANPMGSNQSKSLYEIDKFMFCLYVFFVAF